MEAVEAREEAEMLRLQLDCQKEERESALRAAAAAQARPPASGSVDT